MVDLAGLARRLAEATDVSSAAELFAEHLLEALPGGAARVYLLGPGDRCGTCSRAKECPVRDRCLHLEASLGAFAMPPGHAERIPRVLPPWSNALSIRSHAGLGAPPAEVLPPADAPASAAALLTPLVAGGETIGVLALRASGLAGEDLQDEIRTAASLAGATLRHLVVRKTESRRYDQLQLVNDLGRKVHAFLDCDLLLHQATGDIHRTLGFHNVMILMLDPTETRLQLRAQAGRRARTPGTRDDLSREEGIVGRVVRTGKTEMIADVSADRDFVDWFGDTRSEIAVPIEIEGKVAGVLNVESDQVEAFGPTDRLVLETVALQLAIALQQARLFGLVKENESRYKTLVESIPGAVLHLDLDLKILYVSPAVRDITGLTDGEVTAKPRGLVDLVVPEDQERVLKALATVVRGLRPRDVEFSMARASATPRLVKASFKALLDKNNDLAGILVHAHDRTDEREIEDRLRQSEKLSSIGTLVSGVAHELNNPLAGILGFAQLLLTRPSEEWSRSEIEKIEKNARRCQRIVENLLHFARQSRMTKREAHIQEVIESVLRLNEYQFRMDNVEIERHFDPDVPAVTIDVNSWQQVFINLANNAREAMVGANSPKRVIRFETRAEGELIIRVSDTGPGIPKALRGRVFDPFFTTKETGTGLGLGICWGIVRDHSGSIELEASATGGASFRIVLPVRSSESPLADVMLSSEAPPHTEEGLGKRVLVVDDDSSVCDVVVQTLENHCYSVDVAENGEEAMSKIRSAPYDVVITDLRMPGLFDGVGLYDRILEEMPSLADRVVFLTGNVLDVAAMDRIQARGNRCVEKPFDIHHLARVVREVAFSARRAVGSGSD